MNWMFGEGCGVPEAVAEFTVAEPAEAWLVSLPNYRSTVIEPAVAELAEASKYSRTVPEVLEGTPIPSSN